jgi:hypothetical protein
MGLKSGIRPVVGVIFLALAFYIFSASGHLTGQDQEYFYRTARAIARDHTFAIEPITLRDIELAGTRGREGKFYAQYAPGLPVALAPLVRLADKLQPPVANILPSYRWPFHNAADIAPRMFVSYFNIPITALTAGLLTLLVIRLRYSIGAAIFIGLAFALSTFAWGQARILFVEPLQTFLLLGACVLLIDRSPIHAAIAGCALAAATLVKLPSILALPAFLLVPDEEGVVLWRRPPKILALVIPLAIGLVAYAWHNWSRFGSAMATGYTAASGNIDFDWQPIGGLLGLLFSAGRGLFWFAPLTALALFAWKNFYRQRPAFAKMSILFVGIWLLFHSFYQSWHAGWGWGPRYLLPALPFLLLPLATLWRSLAGRLWSLGIFILGVAIQIPGAFVDFVDSGQSGIRLFQQTCRDCSAQALHIFWAFQIAGSELVRHTALLRDGKIDLAWRTFPHTLIPAITFGFGVVVSLCGVALVVPALCAEAKTNSELE